MDSQLDLAQRARGLDDEPDGLLCLVAWRVLQVLVADA